MESLTKSEYARRYSEKGIALARANGKMPYDKEWEKTQPDEPEASAGKWNVWGEKYNMGVVLGPSKLIVVEYDADDAKSTWMDLTQGVPTWMQMSGSGKLQAFYRDDEGLSRKAKNSLELRAGNSFHVLAPSIHPDTGKEYRWLPGSAPWECELAALPSKAKTYFYAESEPGQSEPFTEHKITAGGRHAALVSLAGTLRRRGLNMEEILESLRVFNQSRCDPPVTESRLKKIAKDIFERYLPEAPLTEVEAGYDPSEYFQIKRGSTIKPKPVEFVWSPFLQESAFQLLAGMKGAGKGTFLAMIAAQITTGELGGRERDVLWIKTEDSFEIDVLPRFLAQEGNADRLLLVHKHVHLPGDVPHIMALTEEYDIGLIVIDPLVGTFSGKDTQEEGGVVNAIGPLNDVAHDLGCLVLGVRHTGKNPTASALDSVLGSVAWVNTPRAVLGLAMDAENHVFLEILAGNRTQKNIGHEYELVEETIGGLETTRLISVGPATKSMDEVRKEKNSESPAKKQVARDILIHELTTVGEESGPLKQRVAAMAGCHGNTVWNAWNELVAEGLGVAHPMPDHEGVGRKPFSWHATLKLLEERD